MFDAHYIYRKTTTPAGLTRISSSSANEIRLFRGKNTHRHLRVFDPANDSTCRLFEACSLPIFHDVPSSRAFTMVSVGVQKSETSVRWFRDTITPYKTRSMQTMGIFTRLYQQSCRQARRRFLAPGRLLATYKKHLHTYDHVFCPPSLSLLLGHFPYTFLQTCSAPYFSQ